mgnify:CR=1 FL=1
MGKHDEERKHKRFVVIMHHFLSPQTLTCPACKSQIPFTLSGLKCGERLTCPGCQAVVSLTAESRQTVQSVADALDNIGHHQPSVENESISVGQQFTGLPLEELIGSSSNAKEKAEAALAMYMTRFLKEHGFEGSFDTIQIEMNLEYPQLDVSDADGISGDRNPCTTFNIPLSAVIPLDSLRTETQDLSK